LCLIDNHSLQRQTSRAKGNLAPNEYIFPDEAINLMC